VREWSAPLWEDGWEGETGSVGDAHLCVATKRWVDGTVDVLVAHDPSLTSEVPTVYAHRHGSPGMTPLTIHGPADAVIHALVDVWGPPQRRDLDLT